MPGKSCNLIVTIHIVVNLIIGGLFYVFSTSEARYESPDCVELRFYSYIFALVTLTGVVFQVFLVQCDTCEGAEICLFFYIIYSMIQLFSIIFVIVALYEDKPCGDLSTLTGVFMIFLMIVTFIYIGIIDKSLSDKKIKNLISKIQQTLTIQVFSQSRFFTQINLFIINIWLKVFRNRLLIIVI